MKKGKYLLLIIVTVIEIAVTILGYIAKWNDALNASLVFASIMFAYLTLFSYLNKDNPDHSELREESKREHEEMRKKSKKEHEEIKAVISQHANMIPLSEVVAIEGNYVETQKSNMSSCYSGVEIWIISNRVDEPEETIKEIFNNLIKGVNYYYVIPNNNLNRCEYELNLTINKIKKLNKNNKRLCIKYLIDDLFDLMPTKIVDILYYCNPENTNFSDNMKVYVSFQDDDADSNIFYKPVLLDISHKKEFLDRMSTWKGKSNWVELKAYD